MTTSMADNIAFVTGPVGAICVATVGLLAIRDATIAVTGRAGADFGPLRAVPPDALRLLVLQPGSVIVTGFLRNRIGPEKTCAIREGKGGIRVLAGACGGRGGGPSRQRQPLHCKIASQEGHFHEHRSTSGCFRHGP